MKRRFQIAGLCVPERNYMVDISGKLEQIKALIDQNDYFTINRGRQYGKTTTLNQLKKMLFHEYIVASISFQGLDEIHFSNSEEFCKIFMKLVKKSLQFSSAEENYIEEWLDLSVTDFELLSNHIRKMCFQKKIVLLIDEVDKTSNNQVFLNFLSMLREKHLNYVAGEDDTFYSVILAGVIDIKNIKLKLIHEETYTLKSSEHIYNSPWNIAVDFIVDMSFSPKEIKSMLREYENDYQTGMNMPEIAESLFYYTSGYPFLVSKLCKIIHELLEKNWSVSGVKQAIKYILSESNTLFDDMIKNMENNTNLYELIYDVLFLGENRFFEIDNPAVKLGVMYGILSEECQNVKISNKIFEIKLYNYFIAKNEQEKKPSGFVLKREIIINNQFHMDLCLEKFSEHYFEIFSTRDISFLERHGRLLFLTYLRPFLNGVGFYHIESETRDAERMDILVDYHQDQFILELKIWYGKQSHENAYQQLYEYMHIKGKEEGYLLTFDFRKEKNKERKAKWIEYQGKRIYDVIV